MEALGLLAIPVGLASLVCWVMVLIKMFKTAGVLHGIIGIICGLYALIWGWMHKEEVGRNLMLIWTVLIVLGIILNVVARGSAGVGTPAVP